MDGTNNSQSKHRYPRRLILHNFLSCEECKELEFIHRSCSTVGYRPNVFSTTLSHLIATNCSHFLMPFVPIRERLKEKVEEFFGCEFELVIEFTGLISWTRGASIGWHSDDNRSYLKQRHFTAVCYLNDYGRDFKGGLFHFQDGEPTTLVPMSGDVAIYTADSCNIHSVDEITEGERLTLTLWFSRDSRHDEDAKLISLLSERMQNGSINTLVPTLASSNMYWFSPNSVSHQQEGFDICCARMQVLGFDIYSDQEPSSFTDLAILMEPLKLVNGNELIDQEFFNILHALQAVHFYCWKGSELLISSFEVESGKATRLSQAKLEKVKALKSLVLKDNNLTELVFGCTTWEEMRRHSFDWARFCAAIAALRDYTCKLHGMLSTSLPYWRTQNIIYCIDSDVI